MAIKFTLNGKPQEVDVTPDMPLLWVLRDTLAMTGTPRQRAGVTVVPGKQRIWIGRARGFLSRFLPRGRSAC